MHAEGEGEEVGVVEVGVRFSRAFLGKGLGWDGIGYDTKVMIMVLLVAGNTYEFIIYCVS